MQKRKIIGSLVVAAALAIAGCSSSATPRTGFDTAPTDPGATPGEGEGEGNPAGTGEPPPAQPEKPGCAQDEYTETLPTKASISGIPFSQAGANDFLLAALEKRYPIGKAIVEGGLSSSLAASQGNCIDRFLRDKSSAGAVLRQSSTIVHECGHFFDLGGSSGSGSEFVLKPKELTFTCKSGDTTTRGGKTFARSLLKKDTHYAKRQACGGKVAQGCDFYADIYLDGSSSDPTFQSGDQGYNSVLEEATQYVNSLASALAFQEQYAGTKVSERDGILTFLWYIERYLAMARTDYPAAYKLLSEDSCWRQATLSVWDRGWFYLKATDGLSNLGMDDAKLETLVTDKVLTSEIDALRKLECK
jgi:hypothetical protein